MPKSPSDMTLYIQLISNVGFPIVVAVILLRSFLVIFQKRLDKLIEHINELICVMKEQHKRDKQSKD